MYTHLHTYISLKKTTHTHTPQIYTALALHMALYNCHLGFPIHEYNIFMTKWDHEWEGDGGVGCALYSNAGFFFINLGVYLEGPYLISSMVCSSAGTWKPTFLLCLGDLGKPVCLRKYVRFCFRWCCGQTDSRWFISTEDVGFGPSSQIPLCSSVFLRIPQAQPELHSAGSASIPR